MPKNKVLPLPLRVIILAAAILLALIFITGYIYKIISSADYFRVREVLVRGGPRQGLANLNGQNIFALDLDAQAADILKSYPDCSQIRMVRLLPNRIFVDFLRRRPVAMVSLYKNYAIDREGFLFNLSQQQPLSGLPLISGLESKISNPRLGVRQNSKELTLALGIIREIGLNPLLKKYALRKIDLRNLSSISLFFALPPPAQMQLMQVSAAQVLEVKLGSENLKQKIAVLAGLLSAQNKEISSIKYIDLRFKDALIKFIDDKIK